MLLLYSLLVTLCLYTIVIIITQNLGDYSFVYLLVLLLIMSDMYATSNMVAPFKRIAPLNISTLTTSLSLIPLWPYDENDAKAKTVFQYDRFIKTPFMDAFFAAGGNNEYLDMPLILGRRTFLLVPANIVTKARMDELYSVLENAKVALKAASTAALKAECVAQVTAARVTIDQDKPKYEIYMELTKFLESYCQFSTTSLHFLRRVLPNNLMRQASGTLTRNAVKVDSFVTSLNNPQTLVVAAETVGLLPQSQPVEEFTKLPTVLKNLNDLVGIVLSHEINNYLRQTSDYPVYKFTNSMKFADWKTKLHFDVMEPLIGTTREYSKHDEVDRVLRMLAGIQRFTHEITQMTIKTLPLIGLATTAAEMDQFYVIFQQLDDHYWNQSENGRSVPIEVNLTGSWPLKKANLSEKIIAYGNEDDQKKLLRSKEKKNMKGKGKGKGGNVKTILSATKYQSTLHECWNCGEPDHVFSDCPDKNDPVKQAQKKLKNALKKRDSLALLASTPDDLDIDDDDDDEDTSPIVSTVSMDDSTKKKQKKGRFPNSKQVMVHVTDIIDRPSSYHSDLSMPRDSAYPLTPRSSTIFTSTHSSDFLDLLSSDYDKDLPVNQATSQQQTQELFMDSGSAFHMMHTAHPSMTDMVTSTKHAVFGNDMHLPIAMEASLGELSRIQLCKGMSKQLLSVPQLCVVNGMISIFTEAGCYTMKRGFQIRMDADDIAFFSPLQNGLYVTSLSDLFIGMGMVDSSTK